MEEKKLTAEELLKALKEDVEVYKQDFRMFGDYFDINLLEQAIDLIERLTEELESKKKECREIADDYQEIGTFYYNETVKSTELQKQVDKLKEENEELYKENTTLIAGSILKRKDMAKKILQDLWNTTEDVYDDMFMRHQILAKAKEFGVEVE